MRVELQAYGQWTEPLRKDREMKIPTVMGDVAHLSDLLFQLHQKLLQRPEVYRECNDTMVALQAVTEALMARECEGFAKQSDRNAGKLQVDITTDHFHAALDYHRAMRERVDANPLTGWKTTICEKLEINSRTLKHRMALWNLSDNYVQEYLKR